MRCKALRGFKMPDWKHVVRKNFRLLGVSSPESIEELATHLEDSYEAFLSEGVPAEEALEYTIAQIEGRCRISLAIRFLQEDLMTGFIQKVAMPGLLTSAAGWFFHWLLESNHVLQPFVWLLGGQSPLWWWYLLPVYGVLGATLSRRNGRSPHERAAASLLPSAILGIVILIFFAVGFTISNFVTHYQLVSGRLESMGLVPPGFVLMPAIFSLIGAGIAEVCSKEYRRLA